MLTRALADGLPPTPTPTVPEDQLLDVDEAATLLGMSVKWLYNNHARRGLSLKLGSRVKFSRKAIEAYGSGVRVSNGPRLSA